MTVLFIIAGLMAVIGALGVVLAKQPVHQVLATILNFLGLAALYLSLSAEFMAVVQLIVYGGAVMILFLFVIALLTVRKDPMEREVDRLGGQRILGFSIGGAVLVML
ncbi:MAG: nuoJ1, partial [Firmicutes bacterium]|nr:nuoJ1 [Bacillota bacterium]